MQLQIYKKFPKIAKINTFSFCSIRFKLGFFCEHVAYASLVDDGERGVVAQVMAQFVYVAVQGVAAVEVVALPDQYHQGRSINRLPLIDN